MFHHRSGYRLLMCHFSGFLLELTVIDRLESTKLFKELMANVKAWPKWTTLFANMSIIMLVECSWTFHVVDRSGQIGQTLFAHKFDPSQIKCCLCCFSCCLKMHGQIERKPWLHLLLAWVHTETLGGSGPIFCSSDVDHFDFFLLLCCSALYPLI